ncbi:hypothetical protein A8C56_03055 [Niabella ginsenosidivorans]|uniref:IPT/TIG domain-containing protein n=1 Tax=Niabella ginsenosidivorans TaxID=1176587 RepID=A0A1A9HXF4_9BACT|nr:IPT/TIG domain-containing protein [Niabella ginsenosidivorans]ANH80098.1 hypothetical protein A8C56_03055 [Niabella ginsenosidivorans]
MHKKICVLIMIAGLLLVGMGSCKKKDSNLSGAPVIEGFLPAEGKSKTEILINGQNFPTDTSLIAVTVNGIPLKIVGSNGHQIMAIVPKKMGSGPIVVTANGQSASSASSFSYQYTRTVTTLAGNGTYGYANGKGTDARFHFTDPANAWLRSMGIAVDQSLNVYVADPGNNCIRKIDSSGNVTLFAGSPGKSGMADGKGPLAQFSIPYGVAVDKSGNVYSVDPGNWDIRKITPDGTATTIGWGAGAPWGIAVDTSAGTIYYTCTDAGTVYSMPTNGGSSTKIVDGLSYPAGITVDKDGNIYVAENGRHIITKIAKGTRTTSVIAGLADNAGYANGVGAAARFSYPWGLGIDKAGNLYVAGNGTWDGNASNPDQSVRMIIAGTWEVIPFAGSGSAGYLDALGTAAKFAAPTGVTVDKEGIVYVLDKNNNVVRKIVSE